MDGQQLRMLPMTPTCLLRRPVSKYAEELRRSNAVRYVFLTKDIGAQSRHPEKYEDGNGNLTQYGKLFVHSGYITVTSGWRNSSEIYYPL